MQWHEVLMDKQSSQLKHKKNIYVSKRRWQHSEAQETLMGYETRRFKEQIKKIYCVKSRNLSHVVSYFFIFIFLAWLTEWLTKQTIYWIFTKTITQSILNSSRENYIFPIQTDRRTNKAEEGMLWDLIGKCFVKEDIMVCLIQTDINLHSHLNYEKNSILENRE